MISRERVIRTLNHQPIDRAPRDLWIAAGIEEARPDDVAEVNVRFPSDFLHVTISVDAASNPSKRHKVNNQKEGVFADSWGCVWKTGPPDSPAILVESPLAGAASLDAFHPPDELLQPVRFAKVNAACHGTGRFTVAAAELRPVERLCQLRGAETALRALAEGNVELRDLLSRLRNFFRARSRAVGEDPDRRCRTGRRPDLALPVAEEPRSLACAHIALFREFCTVLHEHDKFAFFLAHGPVRDVLDDLIEAGVDAVHAQWQLEEFVKVASSRRGRIVFWGGPENRRIESPSTAGRRSRRGFPRSQGRRFRLRAESSAKFVEWRRPAAERRHVLRAMAGAAACGGVKSKFMHFLRTMRSHLCR